jgi:hypothetical protein
LNWISGSAVQKNASADEDWAYENEGRDGIYVDYNPEGVDIPGLDEDTDLSGYSFIQSPLEFDDFPQMMNIFGAKDGSKVYDPKTGLFTITGTVSGDVDGLQILGDSKDPKAPENQVKFGPLDANNERKFTYSFKMNATENRHLSFSFQGKDSRGKEFDWDGMLVIYLSTDFPTIDFSAYDKIRVGDDDTVDIWTNKTDFALKGKYHDKLGKSILRINGNEVYRDGVIVGPGINNGVDYVKGEDNKIAFDYKMPLIANKINKMSVAINNAIGNNKDIKINVHHSNIAPAKPIVTHDHANALAKSAKITAKAASTLNEETVYYNVINPNNKAAWHKYTSAGVSTNTNTTMYFKVVDIYGNESAVVAHKVQNITPSTSNAVKLKYNKKSKKLSATYAQAISNTLDPFTSIQVSFDGGNKWVDYDGQIKITKTANVKARSVLAVPGSGLVYSPITSLNVIVATTTHAKPGTSQKYGATKHKKKGYITKLGKHKKIKVKKAVKEYKDINGKRVWKTAKKSKVIKIKSIKWTKNGTPRIKTKDGHYITASKKFVKLLK